MSERAAGSADSSAGRAVMTAGERQFLIESGAPPDSFDPVRQAQARRRLEEVAERTRQQASPELTTADTAVLLGVAPSTVRRWAHALDLYPVRRGRALLFPTWQFADSGRLPGLRPVLRRLPRSMHPYSVEGWMTSPQEELDDLSAVEWLASGRDVTLVVQLADAHAWL